jgi:hypothetical protein
LAANEPERDAGLTNHGSERAFRICEIARLRACEVRRAAGRARERLRRRWRLVRPGRHHGQCPRRIGSSIYLSWNRPEGNGSGSSFAIELSGASGTTEIARTSVPSYTVRNLEPQTGYCFVVRYFTLIGSRSSNTACATTLADSGLPSVPSELTATPVSPGEVDLSWNPATDDDRVEGYNVFRDGVLLATTACTALDRAAAIPGATHCYSVSAFDPANHESARSAEVCVTLAADLEDPTAPSGLTAAFSGANGQSSIELGWTEASDDGRIDFYRIFRDGQLLTDSTSTSYSDTAIEAGSGHCYTVSAVDAAGKESAQSDPACAMESWSAMRLAPVGIYMDRAIDANDVPQVAFKYWYCDSGKAETQYALDYVPVNVGQPPAPERLAAGSATASLLDIGFVAIAIDGQDAVHIAHKLNDPPFPEAIQHLTPRPAPVQTQAIQQTESAMNTIARAVDSRDVLQACYGLGDALYYANDETGVWLPVDAATLVAGTAGGNCDIAVAPDDSIRISFTESISDDLMVLSNQSGSWAVRRTWRDPGVPASWPWQRLARRPSRSTRQASPTSRSPAATTRSCI